LKAEAYDVLEELEATKVEVILLPHLEFWMHAILQ